MALAVASILLGCGPGLTAFGTEHINTLIHRSCEGKERDKPECRDLPNRPRELGSPRVPLADMTPADIQNRCLESQRGNPRCVECYTSGHQAAKAYKEQRDKQARKTEERNKCIAQNNCPTTSAEMTNEAKETEKDLARKMRKAKQEMRQCLAESTARMATYARDNGVLGFLNSQGLDLYKTQTVYP